jgi:HK97 family phage prohead protease
MVEIIRLPQLIRDAEVRSSSFDEATNTVDVIWTTGATVRRMSWLDGEFDEELVVNPRSVRLDRLNSGAPLLDSHARYELANVIGSVVRGSAKIENGQGVAKVKLSNATDAADRVSRIIEGTVSSVSVGYRIHAVEKKERDGAVALHRVVDWEPFEISAVPVPADYGAQVRSGADDALYSCKIIQPLDQENYVRRLRMTMQMRQAQMAG